VQGGDASGDRGAELEPKSRPDFVFLERLEELNEELETLNTEAHELEERISENVAALLERT
jgi:type I restriction enzyme M protein